LADDVKALERLVSDQSYTEAKFNWKINLDL
jgi:hypothetical protein